MSDSTNGDKKKRRYPVLVATIFLAICISMGIYAFQSYSGNGASALACTQSAAAKSAIDAHVKGEVAALIVNSGSRDVSTTAFFSKTDEPLSLSDFSQRTVLLNLWATWCAPCRKEMPELDRLQAELGSDDFHVATINIDRRNPDRVEEFWQETQIEHLTFYKDWSGAIFNNLRAQSLAVGMPTTLLVGPDGCLIGHLAGQAKWDSKDAIALINAALESY